MNGIKTKAKEAVEENEKLQKAICDASDDNNMVVLKIEENKKLLERLNTITKEKTSLEKKVNQK